MIVLIMAGGLGKRMNSDLPKVCHKVLSLSSTKEIPMLVHVINTAIKLNPIKIFIIVGKYKQIIENIIIEYLLPEIFNKIDWIIQEEALGTGHAIFCALPALENYKNSNVIILSGDVPLISEETLNNLLGNNNKLLITRLENPTGCGRIILSKENIITCIIEEKDCNEEEKKNELINCGIYQIDSNDLINLVPLIDNKNKAGEYYLTDIVKLMNNQNISLEYYELIKKRQYEIKNINTSTDLEELNKYIKITKGIH